MNSEIAVIIPVGALLGFVVAILIMVYVVNQTGFSPFADYGKVDAWCKEQGYIHYTMREGRWHCTTQAIPVPYEVLGE